MSLIIKNLVSSSVLLLIPFVSNVNSEIVEYGYDESGRLVLVDKDNKEKVFTYDSMGNPLSVSVIDSLSSKEPISSVGLVSPKNASSVNYSMVDFRWSPDTNVHTYTLFIGSSENKLNLYKSLGSESTLNLNLSHYKIPLYWQVQATDILGNKAESQVYKIKPLDSDNDLIPDHIEQSLCTHPFESDSDGDGVIDGNEDKNMNGFLDYNESDPCNADTDGDTIPDSWEIQHGSDVRRNDISIDSDNDGQSNFVEYVLSTANHPVNADRDQDGMSDIHEAANGLDPLSADDASLDIDNDGFTALQEFYGQSDYQDSDSVPAGTTIDFEGEAISPFHWFERGNQPWIIDTSKTASNSVASIKTGEITHNQSTAIETIINSVGGLLRFDVAVESEGCCDKIRLYVNNVEHKLWSGNQGDFQTAQLALPEGQVRLKWEYKKDSSGDVGADTAWLDNIFLPAVPDSDGDGALDAIEYEYFSSLDHDLSADGDNDGLTALEEAEIGLDPTKDDTDGDGMNDGWEVANGTNGQVADGSLDLDNDGQSNFVEYVLSTANHPVNADRDQDGMSDIHEAANGLDPLSADDASLDIDNDGFTALQEFYGQSDYQDSDSVPFGTVIDFESEKIEPFYWLNLGNQPWMLDSAMGANDSLASVRAGKITNNQNSAIETIINSQGGLLRFDFMTDSEGNYDKLRIYVNGIEKNVWSGQMTDFSTYQLYLEPGMQRIKWEYRKDASAARGEDTAWLDNIFLPAVPDSDEDGQPDALEYSENGSL